MKYLNLIIAIMILTACSDKDAEKAKNLIDRSDYCLVYKYDSLSKDFSLYNIPKKDRVDDIKKLLIFDGKFKKAKTVSPNYRIGLITEGALSSEIMIEQSATSYLTIKSNEFKASRPLDYELGMYLGEIDRNIYIKEDSKRVSYNLKGDLSNIQCEFYKKPDSTSYLSLSIRNYYQSENSKKHDLTTILEYTDIYWIDIIRDSKINLQTVQVGYPSEYRDVLMRHINGFKNSSKWNEYVNRNGKKPNYELTTQIMLELDVYKPLNDFLKTKGFEIIDMSLEKIGLVLPELLDEYGLDNKAIIPMPHMVWFKIGKAV